MSLVFIRMVTEGFLANACLPQNYCYWTTLAKNDDPFIVVPTKPLPSNRTREEHIKYMRKYIIGKTNDEIAESDEVMEYLSEIGPDTMVPCFSINIKGNTDVNLVNDIVQAVFNDRVSAFRYPMLVTASTYSHHLHSTALKTFKRRLGVDPYERTGVKYIITTCMDLWATSTEFLDDLASIMRNAILCSIGTVTDPNVHHNFVTIGELDERMQMFVYYCGRFTNISHQYYALAKVQFVNSTDGDLAIDDAAKCGGPLVLHGVESNRVHDMLLYDFDEGDSGRHEPEIEVHCYAGLPQTGGTSFMKTSVRVKDVARFDHFEVNASSYPKKSKYFLYGNSKKAYISHIPTRKPDFLQLVELEEIPEGFSPLLLNYGVEISLCLSVEPQLNKRTK